jgi:hypothetical protein
MMMTSNNMLSNIGFAVVALFQIPCGKIKRPRYGILNLQRIHRLCHIMGLGVTSQSYGSCAFVAQFWRLIVILFFLIGWLLFTFLRPGISHVQELPVYSVPLVAVMLGPRCAVWIEKSALYPSCAKIVPLVVAETGWILIAFPLAVNIIQLCVFYMFHAVTGDLKFYGAQSPSFYHAEVLFRIIYFVYWFMAGTVVGFVCALVVMWLKLHEKQIKHFRVSLQPLPSVPQDDVSSYRYHHSEVSKTDLPIPDKKGDVEDPQGTPLSVAPVSIDIEMAPSECFNTSSVQSAADMNVPSPRERIVSQYTGRTTLHSLDNFMQVQTPSSELSQEYPDRLSMASANTLHGRCLSTSDGRGFGFNLPSSVDLVSEHEDFRKSIKQSSKCTGSFVIILIALSSCDFFLTLLLIHGDKGNIGAYWVCFRSLWWLLAGMIVLINAARVTQSWHQVSIAITAVKITRSADVDAQWNNLIEYMEAIRNSENFNYRIGAVSITSLLIARISGVLLYGSFLIIFAAGK